MRSRSDDPKPCAVHQAYGYRIVALFRPFRSKSSLCKALIRGKKAGFRSLCSRSEIKGPCLEATIHQFLDLFSRVICGLVNGHRPGQRVLQHDAAGPINVVAGAQVMMTVPNFYKLETSEWNLGKYDHLIDRPLDVSNGNLKLSPKPGLGIEMNRDYLQDHEIALD